MGAVIYPILIEPDTNAVRKFGRRMATHEWRKKWERAKAAGDYAAMDDLDREYEQLSCY